MYDISGEFEPNERLPMFPWARNFSLIAEYWLFPDTDSRVIYMSKTACFTIKQKLININ